MKDQNFKEDLFGEGVLSRKPARMKVLEGYAKQRYLPYLKLPTEYAVIALIAVLIMLIFAYALGVKVGRGSASTAEIIAIDGQYEDIVKGAESVLPVAGNEKQYYSPVTDEATEERPGPLYGMDEAEQKTEEDLPLGAVSSDAPPAVDKEQEASPRDSVGEDIGKGVYFVYVAAFRGEDKAKSLSDELKSSGMNSGVSKSSGWYQVYAGGYRTIAEANKAKDILQRQYADCYIRKVE
jgi:hypothetical protein